MKGSRFQLGAAAVLFAVCMVCVSVLCLLSVYTAMTDRAAAWQYAQHVQAMTECENLGQQWLSRADAWAAGKGELPEGTSQENGCLRTQIQHENMTLDITAQVFSQGVQVQTWSCTAQWQPPQGQTLWK